jgi:hypothetical protein
MGCFPAGTRVSSVAEKESDGVTMIQAKATRYPYLPTVRQTGAECFTLGDQTLPVNLMSFWQWSASDLVGNTARGCLAEYIVAMALGLASGVRNDWEAYDLQFNGWKIEVKASAYLQSWFQKRLSRPAFSIKPARSWSSSTGEMTREPRRHADVYVFCLQAHKEKSTLNPLDLAQWTFYVLPTARLESSIRFKDVKILSLNSLLMLNPSTVPYSGLGKSINDIMSQLRSA